MCFYKSILTGKSQDWNLVNQLEAVAGTQMRNNDGLDQGNNPEGSRWIQEKYRRKAQQNFTAKWKVDRIVPFGFRTDRQPFFWTE